MSPNRSLGALVIGDEILSGKRADKHLPHVIEALAKRGLALGFAHYLGDDRERLTALLAATFARDDIVFSFGGIGATPDDHTRQAAAAALGLPLARHLEAVASIEQQFGEAAYPNRVLPSFLTGGKRRLELGVRGAPADVDEAFEHLRAGVVAAGFPCELLETKFGTRDE